MEETKAKISLGRRLINKIFSSIEFVITPMLNLINNIKIKPI